MRVLYPPRPRSRISPKELATYEKTGQWWAQRKFNGSRNLVCVRETGEVELFGRHGAPHRNFLLTDRLRNQILSLRFTTKGEYWIDSELLDSKTSSPEYKGKIVLFDLLFAGRYLFGVSQRHRLNLLLELCRDPKEHEPNSGIALQVTEDIWMAETFVSGFSEEFQRFLLMPEVEGLILRKHSAKLLTVGTEEREVDWQLRCRKPHKNYNF